MEGRATCDGPWSPHIGVVCGRGWMVWVSQVVSAQERECERGVPGDRGRVEGYGVSFDGCVESGPSMSVALDCDRRWVLRWGLWSFGKRLRSRRPSVSGRYWRRSR